MVLMSSGVLCRSIACLIAGIEIANGRLIPIKSGTARGSLKVACRPGYEPKGRRRLKCDEILNKSVKLPRCVRARIQGVVSSQSQ